MSEEKLRGKFKSETGMYPEEWIDNGIGYRGEYVRWLELKIERSKNNDYKKAIVVLIISVVILTIIQAI